MTAWMEQELFHTQGRLGDRSEAIAVPGMFHMFVFLFLMDNTLFFFNTLFFSFSVFFFLLFLKHDSMIKTGT